MIDNYLTTPDGTFWMTDMEISSDWRVMMARNPQSKIKIWDFESREEIASFQNVRTFSLTNDGHYALFSIWGQYVKRAMLFKYDLETKNVTDTIFHPEEYDVAADWYFSNLSISPDGKYFTYYYIEEHPLDGQIKHFMFGDFEKFEAIREIPPNELGHVGVPRFLNTNPEFIAATGHTDRIFAYNYQNNIWRTIASYAQKFARIYPTTHTNNDDTFLYSITEAVDYNLIVWNLNNNEVITDAPLLAQALKVTPDDKYLIAAHTGMIIKFKAPWYILSAKEKLVFDSSVHYSKGLISFEYEILSPGEIQIDLYETSGKRICNIFHGHREPGIFHLKYPVDLPSGT
ncbi:MAG: hypothetical protein ACLFQX_03215, partial [Candidatus Kapaibacterium sp.]